MVGYQESLVIVKEPILVYQARTCIKSKMIGINLIADCVTASIQELLMNTSYRILQRISRDNLVNPCMPSNMGQKKSINVLNGISW